MSGRHHHAVGRSFVALIIVLILGAVALSACGSTSTSTPQPNPQPQPTAVKTPVKTGLTVGALSDQIRHAWSELTSFRAVFTTTQSYAATKATLPGLAQQLQPPANGAPYTDKTPVQVQVTDEVVFPDRMDRLILVNGQPILELLTYEHGLYVRRYTAGDGTFPAAEAWREIDETHLTPKDPLFALVTSFKTIAKAPFAASAGTSRQIPLTVGSTVQSGKRLCHVYQAITTTQTGEQIQTTISIGDDHLPCSIVTTAGGTRSETTFSGYNETMALPAVLSTPTASPAASPVTSPAASPVASPATPLASPAATPTGRD